MIVRVWGELLVLTMFSRIREEGDNGSFKLASRSRVEKL
jgi:hypothetical protein